MAKHTRFELATRVLIGGLVIGLLSWAVYQNVDGLGIRAGGQERPRESVSLSEAQRIRTERNEPSLARNGRGASSPRPRMAVGSGSQSSEDVSFGGAPVDEALSGDGGTANDRVEKLREMRGRSISEKERARSIEFLSGKDWPEGMSKASAHWLADELLTVLRLQEPAWDGLAAVLGEVAFQSETDPVIRDYIMQHLGHLWEQGGARQEIEKALWRAVGTTDETTPGSALIALNRGYERDGQEEKLREVRKRAFELAKNPETGLAVRVTALAIAGDGGGREVRELAENLVKNPDTPVILRKVAERIGEKNS